MNDVTNLLAVLPAQKRVLLCVGDERLSVDYFGVFEKWGLLCPTQIFAVLLPGHRFYNPHGPIGIVKSRFSLKALKTFLSRNQKHPSFHV